MNEPHGWTDPDGVTYWHGPGFMVWRMLAAVVTVRSVLVVDFS